MGVAGARLLHGPLAPGSAGAVGERREREQHRQLEKVPHPCPHRKDHQDRGGGREAGDGVGHRGRAGEGVGGHRRPGPRQARRRDWRLDQEQHAQQRPSRACHGRGRHGRADYAALWDIRRRRRRRGRWVGAQPRVQGHRSESGQEAPERVSIQVQKLLKVGPSFLHRAPRLFRRHLLQPDWLALPYSSSRHGRNASCLRRLLLRPLGNALLLLWDRGVFRVEGGGGSFTDLPMGNAKRHVPTRSQKGWHRRWRGQVARHLVRRRLRKRRLRALRDLQLACALR
mmetsp:Transcript_15049/g.35674  ORF Transcript_15049/g.35674 Transcript_15049/m.35674 type:complete len:284 (-) Transcript_15049:181-1032(-)